MKKLLYHILLIAVLALTGCQDWGRKSGVEVIIEGDGEFPQSLSGRWKANKSGWEFVFEPDGRISSAIISMGRTEIVPGRTTTVPTRGGGKGIFKPGLWIVQYVPESRELTIEAVMDYIHFEMGSSLLEGKSTDIIVGEVSEDGKIWRADWFSYPDFMAYATKTKRLTVNPEESFLKTLIFKKIEEKK